MEVDADRKRKKASKNMTEKQKENFEVKVQKAWIPELEQENTHC